MVGKVEVISIKGKLSLIITYLHTNTLTYILSIFFYVLPYSLIIQINLFSRQRCIEGHLSRILLISSPIISSPRLQSYSNIPHTHSIILKQDPYRTRSSPCQNLVVTTILFKLCKRSFDIYYFYHLTCIDLMYTFFIYYDLHPLQYSPTRSSRPSESVCPFQNPRPL